MKSEDLYIHSLKAISPIDGRHRMMTEPLSEWFSEFALFKYRIHLEIEYLIALSELKGFPAVREITEEEKIFLRNIVDRFTLEDAQVIQNIDRFGYQDQKPTNHDFKAAEYFIKMKMKESSLNDLTEMVHFGLTTEDANNIAHNCMIKGALKNHYLPNLSKLLDTLANWAETEKETVMPSKTHGQTATPTTFGKEMANYLERLRKEFVCLQEIKLPAKLNGAVGNHAAQQFAAPEIDWLTFTQNLIDQLGFEPNLHTTQIESHDGLTRLCHSFISLNNILRDLAIDLWLYASQGYLTQQKVSHEVGSSTMPHKINPWRVEVAEGSAVEANAKFNGFVQKWQASRLQRDMSDHEAQRAIGVGVAHSYLTILHLLEELERLHVNKEKMSLELNDRGDLLTEAVQTLLRKEGYQQPYEAMKDFSRGKTCSLSELHHFIDRLELKEETKQKIKLLKPQQYIGLSSQLAELAVENWQQFKSGKTDVKNITDKDGQETKSRPQVLAILGGQWGDEGKGKIVDLIAGNFDLAARATGGNNAGHTIILKGEKHVFHLLPSAITWNEVDCLLGNGMVIDPLVLLKEIHVLEQKGYQINNLFISGRAHIILLYHNLFDNLQEEKKGKKKVGTTGRGIGPCYADKMHRVGVRVNDLLHQEILHEKIQHQLHDKPEIFNPEDLYQAIPQGEFFDQFRQQLEGKENMVEALTALYLAVGEKLKPYLTETSLKLAEAHSKGKNILLEGAQGILLDIDHGTYPFVTSSNPSMGGLKTGLGFPEVDEVHSIIKAYTTRVGGGPFPTELGTEEQAKEEGRWETIKDNYQQHLQEVRERADQGEEYYLGKFMRLIGREYGSTTGRPRRCGWHDSVLTRHTSRVNGKRIIITKLDVLSGLKKLRICNAYRYDGPSRDYDGEEYYPGKIITEFPADSHLLADCRPHDYIEMPGWQEDITQARSFAELPIEAQNYLRKIEELGQVEISIVSVGPSREETIFMDTWNLPVESNETKVLSAQDPKPITQDRAKYKAIIYDMDNTLVATNRFVFNLLKRTALAVSQETFFMIPSDEEIVRVQKNNLPFEDIFKELFPNPENYPREQPLWELVLERYREQAKMMPFLSTSGGVETVKELNKQGLMQGIVTNRVKMASERLNQAGYGEFSFLFQPAEKEYRKPNPLSLKPALDFFRLKGIWEKEIISVGDHPDDYLAAKGAGVDFVAVLTGESTKEDFMQLGLEEGKIIAGLGELKEVIKN